MQPVSRSAHLSLQAQALQASEQALEVVLQAAGIGVWELDWSSGQQTWSAQTFVLFGYAPNTEIAAQAAFWRRVHPKDRKMIRQAYRQALKTGDYQIEHRIVLPNQSIRWLSSRGKVFFDNLGQPVRITGINLDISDRKRTEEALAIAEAARDAASAQNRQKSKYLAMTAHELRNPLMTIQLATEILQEQGEKLSPKTQQKHFQRIQTATAHLDELLDKTLILGQTEADELLFEPTALEVVSFCRKQIEALQFLVDQRYMVQFLTSSEHCLAYLDARLLRQVLTNLLSNAVKYSPQGGVVSLILTVQPDSLLLQVQDQGIGIPPEAQSQLFQSFYRASNVSKISGTGLGLAIVKQCVDLHGGQIKVESVLNQGTTVSVVLPTIFK